MILIFGGVYLLQFNGLDGKTYKDRPIKTGLDISKWLFEGAKVGVVPGECFGLPPEKKIIRMAIGFQKNWLDLACTLMSEAANQIKKSPSLSPATEEAEKLKSSALEAQAQLRARL